MGKEQQKRRQFKGMILVQLLGNNAVVAMCVLYLTIDRLLCAVVVVIQSFVH